MYSGGWKKFEPLWNFLIKTKSLNNMLPVLESILSKVKLAARATMREEDIGAGAQENKQVKTTTTESGFLPLDIIGQQAPALTSKVTL